MTATIALVAASAPERMVAAAAQLTSSIATLEAGISAQRTALAQLMSGWQGVAASAAVVRAEKDLQRKLQLQVRLTAIQSALNSAGAQLSSLRAHILSTAGQAAALGGLVGDDGSVRAAGIGLLMTPAMAAAYSALLKKLLETFDAVDLATATALERAAFPPAPSGPAAQTIPDRGADPQQVHRWWDSVSPEQRQRFTDEERLRQESPSASAPTRHSTDSARLGSRPKFPA